MPKLIAILTMQIYAVLLAAFQYYVGVRTDEAKYLLDIPYPHPPLARFILSLNDGWAYQELFWRIVLATLLVQAAWLVYDIGRELPDKARILLCGCWLLCAAFVYQTGTVMMAPLTALQALVFVWMFLGDRDHSTYGAVIALFWMASLFTAYQAILFAPLVFAIFLRMRGALHIRLMLFALPVAFLALYTLSNPLAVTSIISHADSSQTFFVRVLDSIRIWALGGSLLVSIMGTVGLLVRPRTGLILSFVLLSAYVFLSRYDYYAILFAPLFIAGVFFVFEARPSLSNAIFVLPVTTVLFFFIRPPAFAPSIVPAVMQQLGETGERDILISGDFGHEWQYGTYSQVRRYQPKFLLQHARGVICLDPCVELEQRPGWERVQGFPITLYKQKSDPSGPL